MLKVRRNGSKLRYMPDMPVSDSFIKLVSDAIVTNKISGDLYNKLSEDEKNAFDLLFADTGLRHARYNQSEIDELIRQYNITKGEILAGNDNPILLKQLKVIIMKLMHFNVLNMRDISALLSELFILI